MHYTYLALAIIAEVIATSSLKACDGFTRFWPSVVVVLGYGGAFYCMSRIMNALPVGVIYAIWSGAGIALVSLVAWLVYGQRLDLPAVLGISLIVSGVVILNVFSKTLQH